MVTREDVLRAAELIRSGRLVAFPTETVYGLGANALDPKAVERIFVAKGRPSTSPLIVHVASVEMAKQLASVWPDGADHLARRFWPGPLTLILPKRPHVPDRVTAGLPNVGIRMPAHPVALELIRAAGVPIAAPSANRFTQLSPTSAAHVVQSLGSAVDMVLDGGSTDVGIESTVLSLAGAVPALLRPGTIDRRVLESIVGPLETVTSAAGAHPAPGLHHRHYSPRTPLLVAPEPPLSRRCAWVWWKTERPAARSVRLPADPSAYAQALYATLHDLDRDALELIAVEPVPESDEWAGVRDRLLRASVSDESGTGDRVI